jgi:hypothetical protein
MPNTKETETPACIDTKAVVKLNKERGKQLKKDEKAAVKRGDYGEASTCAARLLAFSIIEETFEEVRDSDGVLAKDVVKLLRREMKEEKKSFRENKKDGCLYEAMDSGTILCELEDFIEKVEQGQHLLT